MARSDSIREIESNLSGTGLRIGIVMSRFNQDIGDGLYSACIDELLRQARKRFRQLGYKNIRSKHDDGNIGWREHAPFDALIVTAARESLDPGLLAQIAVGGIAVAPLGPAGQQTLIRMVRGTDGWSRENLGAVSFVPLVRGVL